MEPITILILGASISCGCVGNCDPVQTEPGYVAMWRADRPNLEIHVACWFSTGITAWDPGATSVESHGLLNTTNVTGLWEYGIASKRNVWELMGLPRIRALKPDYVVVMLGIGDALRQLWGITAATPAEYEASLRAIADAIRAEGAIPVLAVDATVSSVAPGGQAFIDDWLTPYAAKVAIVCNECGNVCGPDLPAAQNSVADYAGTDNIHPNSLGHRHIADAFIATFDALLP